MVKEKEIDLTYTYLDSNEELQAWAKRTKNLDWIAFDTEFIGEKRYKTLLCLIQVASDEGLFLIDPFSISDLTPFLDLISDERILKITHAGQNDYRLLYQNFGCRPKNMVDTQLACGFLSEMYPVNFKRLVWLHLEISLSKGFAVVDWAKRPIQKGAIKYALEDVVYLRDLYDTVLEKIEQKGRTEWFLEEMKTWEDVSDYDKTILCEVKGLKAVYRMKSKDKIFLIRMVSWRRSLAEKRNHSREMVMPTKDMTAVVKLMKTGKQSIVNNRHLKNKSWVKYLNHWEDLYHQEPNQQELECLESLQEPEINDVRQEFVAEVLYRYLSYYCLENQIAINLVVPRSVMRDLRNGKNDSLHEIMATWRSDFIGDNVIELLNNLDTLHLSLEGNNLRFSKRT